jgi:hypothetical protein
VLSATAVFLEIKTQPLRIGVRICQGDVAVRPDEVERRIPKTGSPHFRSPREEVERKLKFGAGFGHAALRLSVHMGLPLQRSERSEVVLSRRGLDPRESIPASDGPGRAHAQRTVAIVDADLRHGLEQKAAHLRQTK